jgi:hypothetical protein
MMATRAGPFLPWRNTPRCPSFRHRFVKPGLLKLARIGGVDFGSFDVVQSLISDMIAGCEDPRHAPEFRRRMIDLEVLPLRGRRKRSFRRR